MKVYCTGCKARVDARLTDGREVYPHRKDLYKLPFWKCDKCENFVGCHHKTRNKTKPLGVIPTKEIKKARQFIHARLDPMWKSGRKKRGAIYAELTKRMGKQYHTAEIQSIEEARKIYKHLIEIEKSLT